MADRIVWFEIPVADPDRAQRFYETIFGISMQRLPIGNEFTLILFPAQPNEVQGALAYHPDFYFPGNQGPLIYLNPRESRPTDLPECRPIDGSDFRSGDSNRM